MATKEVISGRGYTAHRQKYMYQSLGASTKAGTSWRIEYVRMKHFNQYDEALPRLPIVQLVKDTCQGLNEDVNIATGTHTAGHRPLRFTG